MTQYSITPSLQREALKRLLFRFYEIFLAVAGGRHAHVAFKLPGKVTLITEAGLLGDPGYGAAAAGQRLAGRLNADLDDEFYG